MLIVCRGYFLFFDLDDFNIEIIVIVVVILFNDLNVT